MNYQINYIIVREDNLYCFMMLSEIPQFQMTKEASQTMGSWTSMVQCKSFPFYISLSLLFSSFSFYSLFFVGYLQVRSSRTSSPLCETRAHQPP